MLLRRVTPGVVLIAALLTAGCASLGKVLSGTGQPCPDWPGGRWLKEAEPFAENVRRVARDRSDGIGDPLLVKKVGGRTFESCRARQFFSVVHPFRAFRRVNNREQFTPGPIGCARAEPSRTCVQTFSVGSTSSVQPATP